MGTRTFADVAPTAATIALNAYIYGYGGHSLVTPHAALKQLWWTDDQIEAKVTRQFVISKLRGEERGFLDRQLAFGEGLTDDTYMEWILEKAKRLFLILTEIGIPDQIFGIIDDSWDDNDLPIVLDDIPALELAAEDDPQLNKRFYDKQFLYLLRELKRGSHVDYGPNEHIPMEYVHKLPPAVDLQAWDRIHFPKRPDEVYTRRKFALSSKEMKNAYRLSFSRDIETANHLRHEHIAPIYASYTSDDAGYVLSDFVAEHTLATFIRHRTPPSLMCLPQHERPIMLMEWIHCLADAVASIHHRGTYHGAIRPSNILVDRGNRIAFADVGTLATFQRAKRIDKGEVYDYSAPESVVVGSQVRVLVAPCNTMSHFSPKRRMSVTSSGSSNHSEVCSNPSSAVSPLVGSPVSDRTAAFRNFSRHLQLSPRSDSSPKSPTKQWQAGQTPDLLDLPTARPEASDVFSLGCVFLDMVTFVLKGKLNDFVKFRTVRTKAAQNDGRSSKADSSFHADSSKIDAWMAVLRDDAFKQDELVYRGVPEILKLIRRMLAQNSELRPTSRAVRDRLEEVLVRECGIERLCCAGREWGTYDAKAGPSLRDSMSVATDATALTQSTIGSGSGCGSGSDDSSVLTRTETKQGAKSVRSVKSSRAFRTFPWQRPFVRLP